MAMTLVTGGDRPRRLARRARAGRARRRRARRRCATRALDALEGLDVERRHRRRHSTARAMRRRAARASTALFHVAGHDDACAPARDELFRANVDGHAHRCSRRRCAPASSASSTRRRSAAIGPGAARRRPPTRRSPAAPARCGIAVRQRQARGRARGAARRAPHGLPVVIVNPAHVLGRGDVLPLLDRARAPLPAPRDPRLRRRRDVHRRRERRRRAATCWPRSAAAPGERYILGGRNFTNDRLFADLGRLSGVEPPAVKLPLPAALALAGRPQALPGRPRRDRRGDPRAVALVGLPVDEGQARARLDAAATTRSRCIETIEWYREREPELGRGGPPAAGPARGRVRADRAASACGCCGGLRAGSARGVSGRGELSWRGSRHLVHNCCARGDPGRIVRRRIDDPGRCRRPYDARNDPDGSGRRTAAHPRRRSAPRAPATPHCSLASPPSRRRCGARRPPPVRDATRTRAADGGRE